MGNKSSGLEDPHRWTGSWSQADHLAVEADLGRVPRGVVGAPARCQCGKPLVVATAPKLPDGTPFPTTFYMTDPALTVAISRLEAEGFMVGLNDRLTEEEGLRQHYVAAHEDYLERRHQIGLASGLDRVPEIEGVTAGGMPSRVKCLHALAAHSLAAGPGVNPMGDVALQEVAHRGWWDPQSCNCEVPYRRDGVVRVAAIDCGTNSTRLLIADVQVDPTTAREAVTGAAVTDYVVTDLVRHMRITRLGEGVDQTGRLGQAALERTFAAARDYRAELDRLQVDGLRVVATSATRDAENSEVFVSQMEQILGVAPQVVPGEEEAELSFLGALSALPKLSAGPYLVVDVGGGSTELVLGTDSVEQAVSLNVGSVRVSERFGMQQWSPEFQEQAAAWIDEELDAAGEVVDFSRVATLVGVAGTVTTLAGYIYGLDRYTPSVTHGSQPTVEQWANAIEFMVEAPVEQKAELAIIPPGREDVIGGGSLVWQQVLRRVSAQTQVPEDQFQVVVSEHDILDGIALGVAQTMLAQ